MNITQQELGHDILKVSLSGSLDVAGASIADDLLTTVSANRSKVIADLAGVDFVA